MKLFSERYNYTKASDVIIRETITPEIQNAICSCYDRLSHIFQESGAYNRYEKHYFKMEQYLWTYFLNQREGDYSNNGPYRIVATSFLEDNNPWYKKLDLVEFTIKYLYALDTKHDRRMYVFHSFVKQLNYEFERLHFAYRVVNTEIVEITSKEELAAIEMSMDASPSNIRTHLNKALELYAQRPLGDYRNSIKESISAVEAYCREITGQKTLGDALNKLKENGLIIPPILKVAFEKLYAYTNQPDTGIRHALMDEDGIYTPASEEALFMLVSCSSFINYLNKKIK
jgi:hypothetical protein